MRKLSIAILASCSFFVTAQEHTNPSSLDTGEDYLFLYENAHKKDFNGRDLFRMYLYGYVKGVSSTLSGIGYICPPNSANIDDTTTAVFNYLKSDQAAVKKDMDTVMSNALSAAYPCPAAKSEQKTNDDAQKPAK